MAEHDLSLVPITALYEELLNRFDTVVFAGKRAVNKEYCVSRRYKGDHHIAMGLCSDLIHTINREIVESEEPLTPEDL